MSSKEILATVPRIAKENPNTHAFKAEGQIEISDGLFRFLDR